jgi:hypothetical protein
VATYTADPSTHPLPRSASRPVALPALPLADVLALMERSRHQPTEMLQQIARAWQVSVATFFAQAQTGISGGQGRDAPAAILADNTITTRQRQVLLQLYQAFRAENRT